MTTNGLQQNHITMLTAVFRRFPQIEKVQIFGSRAKGNFHERSDIDLAVAGNDINPKILALLKLDLDETDLPFWIDVQKYETIKNPDLKEHIKRVGKTIYKKDD